MKKTILITLSLFAVSCSGNSLVTDTSKTIIVKAEHSGATTFTTDQNITVTLTNAVINWGHLNIISEGEDEECEADHDVEVHLEHEEDLLDTEITSLELESEEIEDFAYCQYSLDFESVVLTGTWDNGISSGTLDFTLEDLNIERAFVISENEETIEHPLHFHSTEDSKTITFTNEIETWFNGLSFEESDEVIQTSISENIQNNLTQTITE